MNGAKRDRSLSQIRPPLLDAQPRCSRRNGGSIPDACMIIPVELEIFMRAPGRWHRDDENRAGVSFIGAPAGVIPPADPSEFPDNFGKPPPPLPATRETRVPEFPARPRFEKRKLEQAAVSSLSSAECDEVPLWSKQTPLLPLVTKLSRSHRRSVLSFSLFVHPASVLSIRHPPWEIAPDCCARWQVSNIPCH